MKKGRYHTNYKGQLIDNTKDWEYKPLTEKTPIQMLNNLNDEFERIDALFKSVGFEKYDYNILEKIMFNLFNKTMQDTDSLLVDVVIDENNQIRMDNKLLSLNQVVDLLNHQRTELWECQRKQERKSSDMESMQQKINVLYTEIMMAKEHMSHSEWEEFRNRRKELEEKVGVEWIRV